MPKFNAYPEDTSILDSDILLKDTSGATATKKIKASTLADYVLAEGGDDDTYLGVNLTTKFATEIAANGNDPWTWIKSRITAGNFTGIHTGDYIPIALSDSTNRNARILGINTYKVVGAADSTKVGNHIDFYAGRDGTHQRVNVVNYNNGTSVSPHPWLASEAYLYLNSLSGNVPNSSSDGSVLIAKDYTSGGTYNKLPAALKAVIVPKQFYLEKRYTEGTLLTDSNGWAWAELGKLWLPTEVEVYGFPVWGTPGYSSGASIQYPYFRSWGNRLSIGRYYWWTINPMSGSSTNWTVLAGPGYGGNSGAGWENFDVPICFRVA